MIFLSLSGLIDLEDWKISIKNDGRIQSVSATLFETIISSRAQTRNDIFLSNVSGISDLDFLY